MSKEQNNCICATLPHRGDCPVSSPPHLTKEEMNFLETNGGHCFKCHKDYSKLDTNHIVYCKERVAANKDGGAMSCGKIDGRECEFQPNKIRGIICEVEPNKENCSGDMVNCDACKKPYCNGCFRNCPDCPSLSPSWEEEFDEKFVKDGLFLNGQMIKRACLCLAPCDCPSFLMAEPSEMRAFISKLLESQKEEILKNQKIVEPFFENYIQPYIDKQLAEQKDTNIAIEEIAYENGYKDGEKSFKDRIRKMVEGKFVEGVSVMKEKGSEFTTPRMYKAIGYQNAIDDIITDLEKENI